jgi:hypothetical protein
MIRLRTTGPRPLVALLASAACLIVSACGPGGPEMAAVSGKVSYNGKPLTKGNVSFVSTDTRRPPASGPIGPDGSYSLQTADGRSGAQLGEYKVAITDIDPDAPNADIPGMPIKTKSDIPKKYADPDKSELKATVTGGSNSVNFDLKD